MNSEMLKKLGESISAKVVDTFEEGTVIRWTAAGRYSYAAIKTSVGWYTTAANNNFVQKTVDYLDLVDILARSETSNVEVAVQWEKVR